ncbi:MAG: ribbon-helix-helix domain-containing protein [Robiginitomaculum sp.]|nr:ribbon-helix-helix domain-containing protein [Robiginitomaculum sp.]
MTKKREKFSTQMDKDLLAELKYVAKSEGRQIQFVVEEAVEAYISENSTARPNPKVMAAAQECIERYGPLLEKLAK